MSVSRTLLQIWILKSLPSGWG